MATIRPFRALRPKPDLAAPIGELPYDVLSSDEARAVAQGNPLSFFHVSKPEIDLSPALHPYDAQVYACGRANFRRFIDQGFLIQDRQPCFYLYRQVMGAHHQVGVVAIASCEDYLNNVIKKHELTRPDKEDDRVRHIEALDAQTGPVFLTYRSQPAINQILAAQTAESPAIDFVARDGVRHTVWILADQRWRQTIEGEFARMGCLYIADGHHRSAAAARVCRTRQGTGSSAYFLCVLFPHDQTQILPYNRVLQDLNGLTPSQLRAKLEEVFTLEPDGEASPRNPHELGLFLENRWMALRFHEALIQSPDPIERLDVSLLQRRVLGPIWGIDDPRTSRRIQFVGGIRGTVELERLVNSGAYACAFSLFPTSIQELMTVADADKIMPPKSTWFEPKLRDGLFSHLIVD